MAHHFAERLSKSLIAIAAIVIAGVAIGDPDTVGRMGRILMDLVYLRPASRKQESEVGLFNSPACRWIKVGWWQSAGCGEGKFG